MHNAVGLETPYVNLENKDGAHFQKTTRYFQEDIVNWATHTTTQPEVSVAPARYNAWVWVHPWLQWKQAKQYIRVKSIYDIKRPSYVGMLNIGC